MMKRRPIRLTAAFTLLEVMIAIAFIGIALISLLALHHSDMQAVIRAQELTRAAMLGQALMSQAELERFPEPGQSHGDFSQTYPGEYPNFRWAREVTPSPLFPDIARVQVHVLYGPGFRNSFNLTEFMHNPLPPTPNQTNPGGGPSGAGGLGGPDLNPGSG
jgi:type II secretory pathway pseudopilin PulG